MKAVALQAVGKMELVDIPVPEPRPGDLKLRVRYCGVCGSDLHEYRSSFLSMASNRQTPIMGHEFSASVIGLGPDVEGFAVGDLVVVNPNEPCGKCRGCLQGQDHLCVVPVLALGYQRVGGFAEYVCAKAERSIKVAPDAPADRLATTEPLAVAVHAVRRGQLEKGETVFIAGAGPIGAFTILAARHKGAGRIIVSEPAASRRELAMRLGADEVIDPTATPPSLRVMELVPGGVDISVECVGLNPPLDDCILSTRRGGRIVVAGVFEMPSQILLLRTMVYEHAIIGAFAYTLAEFTEVAHLIASGAIDVSPVISRTVSLAELPGAFADLDADRNRYHKVLVSPDV
jgi:(R,R)-butanediol dehydrogenase/meso-butanediol dehydrogenase/diacetyl reductase